MSCWSVGGGIEYFDTWEQIIRLSWFWGQIAGRWMACVAGGISRVRTFVLVVKLWKRVAKPWEDWWRVQLNSRLPKFVGFFELCVHQCTRISDWLRRPKRQSNVNLYLSSFPGEKVCFHAQICKMENAKKCREAALDSLNIPWNSRKIIQMEEQERAVRVDFREWCVKWGWLAYTTSKFYGSWHMYICHSLLGHSTF